MKWLFCYQRPNRSYKAPEDEPKERINISKLPTIIQLYVLKKFEYKQMGKFEECCRFSQKFVQRHKHLKYFVEVDRIQITYTWATRVILSNRWCDKVSMTISKMGERQVYFHACKLEVETACTNNIIYFILNQVKQIREFYIVQPVPIKERPFFSKMLTAYKNSSLSLLLDKDEGTFEYDTRTVQHLTLSNSQVLSLKSLFSIKITDSISAFDAKFSATDVFQLVEDLIAERVPSYSRMFAIRPVIPFDDLSACLKKLKTCRFAGEDKGHRFWIVKKPGKVGTFLEIRLWTNGNLYLWPRR